MKIDLDVLGTSGERALTATTLLSHRKIRRRRPARFIVDTGSPVTIMSEAQRQQLQIPTSHLEYSEGFTGVGGGNVQASLLKDVEFRFKVNGLSAVITHDVYVSSKHQDNLLGLDFFEANDLDLHCLSSPDTSIEAFFESSE
jgi:hypothetical protein